MNFEADFWGDCCNTYGEETKQLLYMKLMGFRIQKTWRSSFVFDGEGKSIIDIGGGPCSVLLKFENLSHGRVVDPGEYPAWVRDRYVEAGIDYYQERGEDQVRYVLGLKPNFDIALIYNCLQHCDDPEKVIANAKATAQDLRMFEWIDIPPHEGHPHMLTEASLNRWVGGRPGKTIQLFGESECTGRAWYL